MGKQTLAKAKGSHNKGSVGAQTHALVVRDTRKGRARAHAALGLTFEKGKLTGRERRALLKKREEKRLRKLGQFVGMLTDGSGTPRLVKRETFKST